MAQSGDILIAGRIDSDFFHPEFLELDRVLHQLPTEQISRQFSISDGNHISISRHFSPQGEVPYFRGQDINDFFLGNSQPIGIPQKVFDSPGMKRSHFVGEDVLICIVGASTGSIGLVSESDTPATGSCKIGIIRKQYGAVVDPLYLAPFLMGKFGQYQVRRHSRGTAQGGLILIDLMKLSVPVLPWEQQQAIRALVSSSVKCNSVSRQLYTEAQLLLESELGLDKLRFDKPVGYTARFSELELSRRADAEFFHVKYEPFLTAAKNYPHGWSSLRSQTTRSFPNFDARKQHGDFQYIEIGDISISNGLYGSNILSADRLPANAKIRLGGGEILVSQVRPTRGAIAIVSDVLERETICSGAFYVCTSNDICRREIIWLYLRCMRNVFGKFCGGTSYPTIDSRYLSQFPVPCFPDTLAEKIRELVISSKEEAHKSAQLLDQAKLRVEQLIEEAVRT